MFKARLKILVYAPPDGGTRKEEIALISQGHDLGGFFLNQTTTDQ
jgi:hypothetical protein